MSTNHNSYKCGTCYSYQKIKKVKFCTICQWWFAPEPEKVLLCVTSSEVFAPRCSSLLLAAPHCCCCCCCCCGGWFASSEGRDWDNSRGLGWVKWFCWWLIVVWASGYCEVEMINREHSSVQLCQCWDFSMHTPHNLQPSRSLSSSIYLITAIWCEQ